MRRSMRAVLPISRSVGAGAERSRAGNRDTGGTAIVRADAAAPPPRAWSRRRGGHMDPAASMQRFYELINSGDTDAFIDLLAEEFVEHEAIPGVPPDREGTRQLFTMMRAAFP